MGLRIATNTASESVQKNLKEVSGQIDTSFNRLSSGKRITKASEDAAGLAISTNLEAQIKGLHQATRNATDGISLIQVTEGGLNEVSNILVRLRELSIQASSDTLGKTEKEYLNKEHQQLLKEIDRISQSTSFKNVKILSGEAGGVLDFQVGTQSGDENRIQFDSNNTNASADFIGVAGTNVNDKDDALTSIEDIDQAIDKVSGQKASLGAVQSRLQSTISSLESQTLAQSQALSSIIDTDIAQETAKLASNSIVKEAGIAALTQSNNINNSTLRLIS